MSKGFADAPKPNGHQVKTVEAEVITDREAESAVYAEMDRRDEQMIVAMHTGQSISDMVYDIPFKTDKGIVKCGREGCKYQAEGKPHTHVTGMSIHGVRNIRNVVSNATMLAVSLTILLVMERSIASPRVKSRMGMSARGKNTIFQDGTTW